MMLTLDRAERLAGRSAAVLAERTILTRGRLTAVSFALAMLAAACFTQGAHAWLAAGAMLFALGLLVDVTGIKLAAIRDTGSPFGAWVGFFTRRSREAVCALAIASGQYAISGDVAYMSFGFGVATFVLFYYVNERHSRRVRRAVGVRPHRRPFSVREFQVAVFVVGPMLGPLGLIPVAIVAAGALLAVEAYGVRRLWLAARSHERGETEARLVPAV